jgi:aminoglycoside 2'-N-acetyltransferase I
MHTRVSRLDSAELSASTRSAIVTLCDAAYDEDSSAYLDTIGPGVHLLLWVHEQLASHLMWVTRTLYPDAMPPLRAAYVELVATHPMAQGQGHATRLLRQLALEIAEYELGALSPSAASFYERLGWELWRGPLWERRDGRATRSEDESVMILRLPSTPDGLRLDGGLAVDWRPGEVW